MEPTIPGRPSCEELVRENDRLAAEFNLLNRNFETTVAGQRATINGLLETMRRREAKQNSYMLALEQIAQGWAQPARDIARQVLEQYNKE